MLNQEAISPYMFDLICSMNSSVLYLVAILNLNLSDNMSVSRHSKINGQRTLLN